MATLDKLIEDGKDVFITIKDGAVDLGTVLDYDIEEGTVLCEQDGEEVVVDLETFCQDNDCTVPAEPDEPEPANDDEPEPEPEPVNDDEPPVNDVDLVARVNALETRLSELTALLEAGGLLPKRATPRKGLKCKAPYEGEMFDVTIIGRNRKGGWIVDDGEWQWVVSEAELELPLEQPRRRRSSRSDNNADTETTPAQKRMALLDKAGVEPGSTVLLISKDGRKVKGDVTAIYNKASRFKGMFTVTSNGTERRYDPLDLKTIKVI